MKRRLLILLCLPMIGFGQNINFMSGVTISNFTVQDTNSLSTDNSRVGLMCGFSGDIYRSNKKKISSELFYCQKGSKDFFHMNDLNLTIKAHYFFNDKISFNVGPSLSYIISGRTFGKEGSWRKIEKDDKRYLNLLSYNGSLGLSYNINEVLIIEYGLNISLVNNIKDRNKPLNNIQLVKEGFTHIISISYKLIK